LVRWRLLVLWGQRSGVPVSEARVLLGDLLSPFLGLVWLVMCGGQLLGAALTLGLM
jgi:hypothetical protein